MMLLFSGTPKNKTRILLGGVKDVLAILSFPASFNSSWILDALFILGYNLGVMSRKPPPKNEGWVGLTENANKSDGQPHRRGGGGVPDGLPEGDSLGDGVGDSEGEPAARGHWNNPIAERRWKTSLNADGGGGNTANYADILRRKIRSFTI